MGQGLPGAPVRIDPDRDVVIRRVFAAPPGLIWRCWTEPALLCQWYLPRPWFLADAIIDLRPGGRMALQPGGQPDPEPGAEPVRIEGSILEVVPGRKLVFTDLFGEDYAPFEAPDTRFGPNFTVILTLAPQGAGTVQTLVARHRSAADATANRDGGFAEGWAIVADQLEQLARTL